MTAGARPLRIHVEVRLPPAEGYDVIVGTGAMADLVPAATATVGARTWAILTDTTVAALYGDAVLAAFESARLAAHIVAFEPGEQSKTRRTWAELSDRLFELGLGRDGAVVALGGGVTGDLAGFVAATYMRGIPLVQVPTTLLAMVDASVGGKTGVDAPAGKNLVGAFLWPAVVIADPAVLRTLPDDVYRAGLAEAVKHAAIADPAYLAWIEQNADPLVRRDGEALAHLIRRSIEIKARVVAEDPLETGRRAILNFGHTVGHALERLSGYAVPHGYAVAIGMVAEARAGERIGLTEPGCAERLSRLLSRFRLPVEWPADLPAAGLIEHALRDKKNRGARIRCALLSRAGEPARSGAGEWTVAMSEADLAAAVSPER